MEESDEETQFAKQESEQESDKEFENVEEEHAEQEEVCFILWIKVYFVRYNNINQHAVNDV